MFEGVPDILHDLRVVADVHVVVQANQGVGLFMNSFGGLLRAYHEREHLGVAVGVVRLKVAPADLPRAEEFRCVVGQRAESVGGCFGQFLSGGGPYFLKRGFQIGLRIVRCTEGDEFAVWLQDIVPTGS